MKLLLILLLACMLLTSILAKPVESGSDAVQATASNPKSPHKRALYYRARRAAKKDSSSAIKDFRIPGRPG